MGDVERRISFCHALIDSFGPESSSLDPLGSALDERDEEAAVALVTKMNALTQNELLFGPCLDKLTETEFVKNLSSPN